MLAQEIKTDKHPGSHKYQYTTPDTTSGYIYNEASEWSEGKAFVAKGDLYAYIDTDLNELTPYVFAQAGNFINGFAVVGDSNYQSVLNRHMQLILPLRYVRARLPQLGLIVVQSAQGLWGAYDTLGNQALPVIYDLPPQILSLERIIVRKDDLYGVVNSCNEVQFKCRYQYIHPDGIAFKQGKQLRIF
jgi:hypothetical protein